MFECDLQAVRNQLRLKRLCKIHAQPINKKIHGAVIHRKLAASSRAGVGVGGRQSLRNQSKLVQPRKVASTHGYSHCL